MGYVENLKAQAQQAAKADAFDVMQKQNELKAVANQAYNAGSDEVLKAVQRRLSPQMQREQNLYNQQVEESAALRELDDNRSVFEKGVDGLAGMFGSKPQVDPRVTEIQQMQAEKGQPVMGTEYLTDWLMQQDTQQGQR